MVPVLLLLLPAGGRASMLLVLQMVWTIHNRSQSLNARVQKLAAFVKNVYMQQKLLNMQVLLLNWMAITLIYICMIGV